MLKRVSSYVGPEQEYFIVNREKYLERPDLIYAGRTLSEHRHRKDRRWRTSTSDR